MGIVGRRLPNSQYVSLAIVLGRLFLVPPEREFFFLYWMLDPHEPYRPIPRFKERMTADPSPLPQPAEYYERARLPLATLSEAESEYARKLYIAEVESVDERVGFIVEALKQRGVLDDTYIVFTADHGEMFGAHEHWGHPAFYYDDLLRIPLIVAGPGIPKGERVRARVSMIDVMPTLKDLLGADYDDDMQGESFLPLLLGHEREARPVYMGNMAKQQRTVLPQVDALIEGNYKLISLVDGGFELYDLATDPGETQNLAQDKPDVVKNLFGKIEKQRAANETRRIDNDSQPADTTKVSEEEIRQVTKKLRALGYVK